MATDVREVHVLVQDAERGSAQWWRERTGAGPSDVAVQDLPPSPRHGVVWTARHWATDRARDLGAPPEQLQDIALLTSELVSNAVVHGGGGQVEVRFGAVDQLITIAVSDFGGGLPQVRDTDLAVPGGLGLRLVAQIASGWGHHARRGGGKTVWFSIRT